MYLIKGHIIRLLYLCPFHFIFHCTYFVKYIVSYVCQVKINKKIKIKKKKKNNKSQKSQHHLPIRRTVIVIPYIKGLSEELRHTLKQHGVDNIFKPYDTLRQQLSFLKDPQKQEDTCGPIYRVTCQGADCGSSYVGETERTLKSRFVEHLRPSSASSEVSQHIHRDYPGHKVEVEVLDHEDRWLERGIKGAIYIRVHRSHLNCDTGRYLLSHI